ncbi:hypothetical protein AG1IA_01050 [Rhizoctonia solani AG-1 IA]|uniref:Uncharacterized protein n=1 Tax=Thanatephorus cucumeris (strain AG1-IA) TaxID=983506 RepID=L8X3W3_THACA|nr:hypothetical protein AG1IA_01050 [Rhizoctonia solani AG-1 IA]
MQMGMTTLLIPLRIHRMILKRDVCSLLKLHPFLSNSSELAVAFSPASHI